jgi:hypothetical protein
MNNTYLNKTVTINFKMDGNNCEGCCFNITVQNNPKAIVCGLFQRWVTDGRIEKCIETFGNIININEEVDK